MKIYSFIPVRSGSKSIPLKNIKEIGGKPLTQWVIDSSNNSKHINKTIISTDSNIISDKLKNVEVFWRSEETATDTATSESALVEFCETLNRDDIVVFIQATSPLLTTDEIDEGIKMILTDKYDSILSVVRQKRFIWGDNGVPKYDLNERPRRQDWNGYLVENGAFYINSVGNILDTNCRLSGNIGMVECSEESYYEIDESSDWIIVEKILESKN